MLLPMSISRSKSSPSVCSQSIALSLKPAIKSAPLLVRLYCGYDLSSVSDNGYTA